MDQDFEQDVGRDVERRWEDTAIAVAHELRTPLTVAQAAVDALASSVDDDETRMLVDAASRSLRAIELQIARLRRLQGVTSDDLDQRSIDLPTMARELIDDLSTTLLHDHPTRLDAPGALTVTVDPDQIRQVLYNLLSNAAKYSPAGREVVVTIRSTRDELMIRVEDQGHGVAPEDADRIFGKYERAGQRGPGAGLGLYLSRLVIEAHGGTLQLRPAEGEGAIFEIVLPAERVVPTG